MEIKINNGVTVEVWVIDIIGSDAWEQLQESSRTEIITAIKCYLDFGKGDEPIDYASSILPIMKAIEYELKSRFYRRYISFLMERYKNPCEYADIILLDKDKKTQDKYKVAYVQKKKVLKYNKYDNRLEYAVDEEEDDVFTFKDFIYTISTSGDEGNRKNYHINKPVIDYCLEVLYPQKDKISRNNIRDWLHTLLEGVEEQRGVRNSSAHGGKIQNKMDAEKAIKAIITEGKLLARIVHPPFLD